MSQKKIEVIRNDSGALIVLVAVLIAVLGGFAALAFDLGKTYFHLRGMQIAADAGTYAGVQIFADPTYPQNPNPGQQNSFRTLAQNRAAALATANGYTVPPGDVIAGQWDDSTKLFTVTNNLRYNALRIPIQRTLSTTFARFVGINSLSPTTDAVSVQEVDDTSGCVRPFGVPAESSGFPVDPTSLSPLPYTYDPPLVFEVGWHGEGNWGKIDLLDHTGDELNMSAGGNPNSVFQTGVRDGVCGSTSALNPPTNQPDGGEGNSGWCDGLNQILGQEIYFFITGVFDNPHPVDLLRYAKGKVRSCTGTGSREHATFEFLGLTDTLPNGGTSIPGERSLVY